MRHLIPRTEWKLIAAWSSLSRFFVSSGCVRGHQNMLFRYSCFASGCGRHDLTILTQIVKATTIVG
ncbi:hypothetical protein ACKS0A_04044 [Histoplasma ohiense]